MKGMKEGVLAAGLLIIPGVVNADLFVDIEGTPGSSLVSMTISGSGTWGATETEDVILYNAVDGAFAGSALAIGSGDLNPSDSDWISLNSSFTLDNNGTPVVFDRIYIQDEGSAAVDDISLGTSSGNFTSTAGTPWSIPETTVTFDLALLGDPDSGAIFDDLGIGTHPATIYNGSHQTGALTLNVSAAAQPTDAKAIPTMSVWGLGILAGLMGLLVFRRQQGTS